MKILVIVFLLCMSSPTMAETIFLIQGYGSTVQPADDHRVMGFGLGVEHSMNNHFSWMLMARKETLYLYDGYMGSFSLAYRGSIGHGFTGRVHFGIDGGLATSQYNRFNFRLDQGKLHYQRWEFADQNTGILLLSPKIGFSVSYPIGDYCSVRPDASFRFMRYGVKEARGDASGNLRTLRDDSFWKPVPTLSLSFAF